MTLEELETLGTEVLISASHRETELAQAIEEAKGGSCTAQSTHCTPVYGGDGSIRIFFDYNYPGTVGLQRPRSSQMCAEELVYFSANGARYPDQTGSEKHKGWSISAIDMNGRRAVLARAVWI